MAAASSAQGGRAWRRRQAGRSGAGLGRREDRPLDHRASRRAEAQRVERQAGRDRVGRTGKGRAAGHRRQSTGPTHGQRGLETLPGRGEAAVGEVERLLFQGGAGTTGICRGGVSPVGEDVQGRRSPRGDREDRAPPRKNGVDRAKLQMEFARAQYDAAKKLLASAPGRADEGANRTRPDRTSISRGPASPWR